MKRFGNWRAKLKHEEPASAGKLLYRRGGPNFTPKSDRLLGGYLGIVGLLSYCTNLMRATRRVVPSFTLAAAHGTLDGCEFEEVQNIRDIVAKAVTPAQIAEAHKLAREWLEKHGQ